MAKYTSCEWKKILEKAVKKQKIAEERLIVYDCNNDDDCKKLREHSYRRHTIIVWDGRSNGITQTPMRWALDVSIDILDSTSEEAISIYIFDLTAKKQDRECGMRMRQELLAEMPWVRLYAPLVPTYGEQVWIRERYIPAWEAPSSLLKRKNEHLILNLCGKPLKVEKPLIKKETLTSLADQWDASLKLTNQQTDQLIQLIWLLLQEECKPRGVDLDVWWHKPFSSGEPSYLVLLDRLSERCGYLLNRHNHQVDEVISAVLKKRG